MPELRQDLTTGTWVVVATERSKRPDDFVKRGGPRPQVCPFEYGNESMTPPETFAFRPDGSAPDTPGWIVRVVPNKFPAFTPEDYQEQELLNGLYRYRKAYGAHEVVVHGPDHNLSLATYPERHVAKVIEAYKLRYQYHVQQQYGRYVQIILNHGEAAGASLEHSHSQIFAIPIVPERVRNQLDGAARYYEANGRCVFCDIVSAERQNRARTVEITERFMMVVPYAAQLPFETWILPLEHNPRFETITEDDIADLASIFRNSLRRLYYGFDNTPFNMYLRSSPPGYERTESYHWYMSIIPKLTTPAGFELGTGMTINVTIPENSAEILRNVRV